MMKLIEELKKQENAFNTEDYRMLNAIKAGDYFLSIQGSRTHYCTPRESLPVDAYYDMELAIYNKHWKMLSINRSNVFRRFNRYNELIGRADGLNSKATVYGYVPVDLLNDLYCFLLDNKK